MIGIEILKPVKVSLFQDTQKLKKVSQKESLKDYRKDVSNNAAAQGPLVNSRPVSRAVTLDEFNIITSFAEIAKTGKSGK